MRTADQTAHVTAAHAKPQVDFQVSRNNEAYWTIKPVSEKAKEAAVREFGLDGAAPQDSGIVVGYVKSNALLHGLRSRGFSILYYGPTGPITL